MQEHKPSAEAPEELLQAPAGETVSPAQEQPAVSAAADTMPSTEELLRQAELKAAEHHDAWLRARADAENVRRRAQEDIAKASKFASEKFANALLPVKDSLEAALATENQTLESLREGVELTLRQLAAAFQSAGVSEENPVGSKFDPNRHQAIAMVEAEGEPNTVINVLQKGYLLHERVLRPAMVTVSKGKNA